MKVVAVGLLAVAVSLATVLAGAALQARAWPSGHDAIGFAAATAVLGILLVGVLYWPVLARVRRRSGSLRAGRAAVLAALILNVPVYVALGVVSHNRGFFADGEAVLIGLGLAVLGLVFGVGYATTQRGESARSRPDLADSQHPGSR